MGVNCAARAVYPSGHMSSPSSSLCSFFSVLCGVLYIVVCSFLFGFYVVCPHPVYGLWLPVLYLQTLHCNYR